MPINFVQPGHYDGSIFVEDTFRAQDVIATNGVSAETHITNGAIHLTTAQVALITNAIQNTLIGANNGVAPIGADGKVPAQYIAVDLAAGVTTVATYAALLALTAANVPVNKVVLVEDATGDSTVDEGWAMYIRTGTAGTAADWFKLTEQEGLDIDFSDFLTNDDKGAANGVAPLDGGSKVPTANLPAGTTSEAGILQLLDGVNSTDTTKAATPNSVKTAYDYANTANTAAANAMTEAQKLDFLYAESDQDIIDNAANLRTGALIFKKVDNAIA